MSAALRSILDSDIVFDSHMSLSLSTPMTATSSGTRSPRTWHARRTSKPDLSLHARMPQGLGISLSHLAISSTAVQLCWSFLLRDRMALFTPWDSA